MRITSVIALVALTLAACATEDEVDDQFDVSEKDEIEDTVLDQMNGKADGGTLSYQAVARVAKTAGLSCTGERIAVAVAVAKAESGFRPTITNTAGNVQGIDRGLWQINSFWHPDVTAACAFSPSCNARAMARISSDGTKWSPWWTYKNGKHWPFMTEARGAQAAVCE